MIDAAHDSTGLVRDWCRQVLEDALAPFEAPPFVLSAAEQASYAMFRRRLARNTPDTGVDLTLLLDALDRACKTLGVAQSAPRVVHDAEVTIALDAFNGSDADDDDCRGAMRAALEAVRKASNLHLLIASARPHMRAPASKGVAQAAPLESEDQSSSEYDDGDSWHDRQSQACDRAIRTVGHQAQAGGGFDWQELANAQERQLYELTEKLKQASAPAVEPLSDELRGDAERIVEGGILEFDQVSINCARELLRRFHKPAVKTNEELAAGIHEYLTLTGYAAEDLAELVRRANGASK